VESANDPEGDFPLENLPFGVFRLKRSSEITEIRLGVAIGDQIVDVPQLREDGILEADASLGTLTPGFIPDLRGSGKLRRRLIEVLSEDSWKARVEKSLIPQNSVRMLCPINIHDYTDFYASIHHATNVGRLFRPDAPLLPNYKWVPIGYHGRASSIVVSGTEIRRPFGQAKAPDAAEPTFGPSRMLDYELEVGFFVSDGNALGTTIPLEQAEKHIFGLCLVNDWSARDIQAWEYQPLGPFLGKSFGTTI
jgi:fumarylacetoacetase